MKKLRHFLTVGDLSEQELQKILREASKDKLSRFRTDRALAGKIVALVFQKPSMRTRVSFEVAVIELGGSVIYLGQEDIQLGQREPTKDVARGLSRYVDAIVVRTFSHHDVEEFARCATVPVINGLSDTSHPCQALADLLTIKEHFGRLKDLHVSFIGDGNNVLHSLMEGCAISGVNLAVSTPRAYRPDMSLWCATAKRARANAASLSWTAQPHEAVRRADVVYTDVWVSMGKEKEKARRRKVFRPYQLNSQLLKAAKPGTRVMHCLPAHRGDEITDQVMESEHSLIFEQAENRLHAQKALLRFLIRGGRDA